MNQKHPDRLFAKAKSYYTTIKTTAFKVQGHISNKKLPLSTFSRGFTGT
jgi:hypothetical protein